MQRFRKLVFVLSIAAICWLGMMAVHELGHIVGAVCTGGSVTRVVLHPLTISRTDVSPNPHPGIVVWCGPIVGSLLPFALAWLVPRKQLTLRKLAGIFAGFCLIANGAYISLGAFDQVGDCGEMLRTGTPVWVLIAFGLVTIPSGLALWHVQGSFSQFIGDASVVTGRMAFISCGTLAGIVILEFSLSLL
ncbi:MAG TPA: M50 family metallopeptidase [Pirellulaceae bacterium]|jgi:hypothetical protein|nr:M50 family metallopeptidase [Pirellulaceae bacterium]